MSVKLEKYVGRRVLVIYQDSKGAFSQRQVTIYSIRDGRVRVLDWSKKSFRTLLADRILSALPMIGRAV